MCHLYVREEHLEGCLTPAWESEEAHPRPEEALEALERLEARYRALGWREDTPLFAPVRGHLVQARAWSSPDGRGYAVAALLHLPGDGP